MTMTTINLSEERCPACTFSSISPTQYGGIRSDYRLVKCNSCHLVYAVPRPSLSDLRRFYSEGYFARQAADGLGYEDYYQIAEFNARQMWKDFSEAFQEHLTRVPHTLLDVGCATGGFIWEASKDGWKVVGVDMASSAVEDARNRFGLEAYPGDIHSPGLQPETFGLITMWHVLEHLLEPQAALKRAGELLQTGGLLFIELPNWWSIGRRIRGAKWSQMKPPEHINYYSPLALRHALSRAGFEVVHLSTVYPSLRDRARQLQRFRLFHLALWGVAMVMCRIGWGGYVRALARKAPQC